MCHMYKDEKVCKTGSFIVSSNFAIKNLMQLKTSKLSSITKLGKNSQNKKATKHLTQQNYNCSTFTFREFLSISFLKLPDPLQAQLFSSDPFLSCFELSVNLF